MCLSELLKGVTVGMGLLLLCVCISKCLVTLLPQERGRPPLSEVSVLFLWFPEVDWVAGVYL